MCRNDGFHHHTSAFSMEGARGSFSVLQLAVGLLQVVCSPFQNKWWCFFRTVCKICIFENKPGGIYLFIGAGSFTKFPDLTLALA